MPDGLGSQDLYSALVASVALIRLFELVLSRRNVASLKEAGAVEVGGSLYPWMAAMHATFLVACVAEVRFLDRPLLTPLAVVSGFLLIAAAVVRFWAIATLGKRWTTRVLVLPGASPVTTGPYRWIRHPNYLAVVIEFAALPMIHTAWLTALVYSLANAIVLSSRIRTEEEALAENGDYLEAMGDRPSFFPGAR